MPHLAPSPPPTASPKKTVPPEPVKVDLALVVKNNVLKGLGKPPTMEKFRIVNIFNNAWRITIYCWRENKSLLQGKEPYIAHSIFVKVNENGEILTSDPPLIKQYE